MSCSSEYGYEPPLEIKCQCKDCVGLLKSDGRNRSMTLTFLVCDACGHCYQTPDLVKS